jgi:hypothetical protein
VDGWHKFVEPYELNGCQNLQIYANRVFRWLWTMTIDSHFVQYQDDKVCVYELLGTNKYLEENLARLFVRKTTAQTDSNRLVLSLENHHCSDVHTSQIHIYQRNPVIDKKYIDLNS